MRSPLITLTTDFGLRDHFVATMKGVILAIAPGARITDITHLVEPFAIAQAAFTVDQAARWFPQGTIHVVVVDPGVGSARRPLVAEAGGQLFVGPDNGVLSMVFARSKPRVREITASRYFLKPVSRTFHGRDIFAPVAAHLARGLRPLALGKTVVDYVRCEFAAPARVAENRWRGSVLAVDRFGNLITNFPTENFGELTRTKFGLKAGRRAARRLVQSYSEGRSGELLVIGGSSGFLEVAAHQASAAQLTGAKAGDPLELTVNPTPG